MSNKSGGPIGMTRCPSSSRELLDVIRLEKEVERLKEELKKINHDRSAKTRR